MRTPSTVLPLSVQSLSTKGIKGAGATSAGETDVVVCENEDLHVHDFSDADVIEGKDALEYYDGGSLDFLCFVFQSLVSVTRVWYLP